jgi:hypothetical protein
MKNKIYKTALIISLGFLFSCAKYNRLGDFTVISNRNIDSGLKYEIVARNVEIKVKTKNQDALEAGIDELTAKYEGEYLMNAKLFMKQNGKKFKIISDVYGFQKVSRNISSSVALDIEFKIGDKVAFKNGNKLITGKISGINEDGGIIEYSTNNKIKRKQIAFKELTKLQ